MLSLVLCGESARVSEALNGSRMLTHFESQSHALRLRLLKELLHFGSQKCCLELSAPVRWSQEGSLAFMEISIVQLIWSLDDLWLLVLFPSAAPGRRDARSCDQHGLLL